jgi:NodT family efflux transporter outer membrane factor (OMF) lipoprotein
MMQALSLITALAAAALLAGCASYAPPATPTPQPPAAWMAPLPHGGSAEALADWWQRFDDAQLLRLIERAQGASPTLQAAAARLRQAQAQAAQSRALLAPQLQAQANATRSKGVNGSFQPSTSSSAALAASWEIDLFGSQRAQAAAGSAQAQAAEALWHEARVSLAADVAAAYLALRHAQAQEEVAELDWLLAGQLAAWGQAQHRAGLISASDAALLNTERAVAASVRAAQRAEAQIALQSLALLCAQPAAALAAELAPPPLPTGLALPQRPLVSAPPFALQTLPAQVLAQRPDLAAAHQLWLAALQRQRSVQAQSWPQLSLNGLIGSASFRIGGEKSSGASWSIGPSFSLPLFDGGLRSAQRDAAQAELDESAFDLQQRWLRAVAEVEEALQLLQAGGERQREVDAAAQDWLRIVRDTSSQADAGLQSGPQRASARRQALAAHGAALAVRLEHAQAWVRLYRSLGGGWTAATANTVKPS